MSFSSSECFPTAKGTQTNFHWCCSNPYADFVRNVWMNNGGKVILRKTSIKCNNESDQYLNGLQALTTSGHNILVIYCVLGEVWFAPSNAEL